jgi:hypothetical protein
VLALGIVLILIVLGLWALKLVFRASSTVGRSGKRRLAVIDTLPVDGKRQLVIIRRDNVEHLILTGGPQDVVVETGFIAEIQPAAPRPVPTVRRPTPAAAPPAPLVPGPGPQRAPAPVRAAAAESVAPLASNDVGPVRGSLERLRDFGRPATVLRRPASLRHTGLMRPVSRMEPALLPANTDNSARPDGDSATSARITPFGIPPGGSGQAFGRDDDPREHRDEGY